MNLMVRTVLTRMPLLPFASRVIKWHLRHIVSGTASPLACGLYISSACNLRCSFCNIRRCDPPYTVTKERARRLVKELGALKTVYFSISGGEPLLVPYVFDLLEYAKSAGILYTHVVSNGLLMDAERARAMAKAAVSEISFSLDGPEPFHDAARGVAGSYRRVLSAVAHARSHAPGTRVVLNTILDPAAPDNALHAVGVARELGVQIKVQPRNDHPPLGGANSAPQGRHTFSPEERKALEAAVAALIRAPHVVNSRPFLKNYLAFLFHPNRLMLAKSDCILGHHHVENFADRLFPCLEGMGWTNGFEWGERPLSETFRSAEYVQKLRELRGCTGCQRSYYVCYYEPRLNFPLWNLVRSHVQKMPRQDPG